MCLLQPKLPWSQQFTYGKLYAPALSHESLDTILDYLSPHGVVAVRKLNPKVSAPLYVLTFLGPVHLNSLLVTCNTTLINMSPGLYVVLHAGDFAIPQLLAVANLLVQIVHPQITQPILVPPLSRGVSTAVACMLRPP